jgi:hypothetical protein
MNDGVEAGALTEKHLVDHFVEILPNEELPAPSESRWTKQTRELIEQAAKNRRGRGVHGGITLGTDRFYQLNKNWGGIDVGTHLIAADTNIGKSSLLRMMAWDIIQNNPKVHVRFYTLDDGEEYFFDCFLAQAAKVPINAVHKPEAFEAKWDDLDPRHKEAKRIVARGEEMYKKFLRGDYLRQFSFIGIDTLESAEWSRIRDDIKAFKSTLPEDMKLVVCIDNFHDVEIEAGNSDLNERTEQVAIQVDRLAKEEQIVFLGTAELKKNNQRRPILDDILGSRKWKYKARTVFLLYSEVGVGKPNPRIFFQRDGQTEPGSVLEIHFAKSKVSEFKGRMFMEQFTEMGWMVEAPPDRAMQYATSLS